MKNPLKCYLRHAHQIVERWSQMTQFACPMDFCVLWDAIGNLGHHMELAHMTQTVKWHLESGISDDPRCLYVGNWNEPKSQIYFHIPDTQIQFYLNGRVCMQVSSHGFAIVRNAIWESVTWQIVISCRLKYSTSSNFQLALLRTWLSSKLRLMSTIPWCIWLSKCTRFLHWLWPETPFSLWYI